MSHCLFKAVKIIQIISLPWHINASQYFLQYTAATIFWREHSQGYIFPNVIHNSPSPQKKRYLIRHIKHLVTLYETQRIWRIFLTEYTKELHCTYYDELVTPSYISGDLCEQQNSMLSNILNCSVTWNFRQCHCSSAKWHYRWVVQIIIVSEAYWWVQNRRKHS